MDKLNRLQLEVKGLHEYRVNETILFARCGVTGREMHLTFYGGIQVRQNEKIVKEFTEMIPAVKFFNDL